MSDYGKRSLTYREHRITEGDVYYLSGYLLPLTVVGIYQTSKPKVILGYANGESIIDASVVFNRLMSGSYTIGGTPKYAVGKRLRTPTTDTLVTILAVSDRQVLTEGTSASTFHYFVQHVAADGTLTYTTLPETTLDGYSDLGSMVIRPVPDTMEHDLDPIDLGEISFEI